MRTAQSKTLKLKPFAFPEFRLKFVCLSRTVVYETAIFLGYILGVFDKAGLCTQLEQSMGKILSFQQTDIFSAIFRFAVLETGLILAFSFCAFGELYTAGFFMGKGLVVGLCTRYVSAAFTSAQMVLFEVGIMFPYLIFLFMMIWLSESSGRISRKILCNLFGYYSHSQPRELKNLCLKYVLVLCIGLLCVGTVCLTANKL